VTVAVIVSAYAPGATNCAAGTRPKTVSACAAPLPTPVSVSVPTVLPQLMVRPSFCDS
jgi:hypothetical protein